MSRSPSAGLHTSGATVLLLALGLAGGLFDVLTGPGLRLTFAVCFVAGAGLAALLVRRRDLAATVVMPPLVYCVIALVAGAVQGAPAAGSFVVQQALELFTALVLEAPALMAATGLALVVALARGLLGRRPALRVAPAPQRAYEPA